MSRPAALRPRPPGDTGAGADPGAERRAGRGAGTPAEGELGRRVQTPTRERAPGPPWASRLRAQKLPRPRGLKRPRMRRPLPCSACPQGGGRRGPALPLPCLASPLIPTPRLKAPGALSGLKLSQGPSFSLQAKSRVLPQPTLFWPLQ